ncbi:tRNA (adenosine(37)-N6)-threonylcarbamoyltransferase complex ATPase subunit type 1 TsaE [Mucisphaera sp.]|uniref:tRNA (adenosine(37)-N6)-threonylcarbamoyltransferase complex ATPase subunit type 1 TsaE n=1 Tax=Mucisphaera sp. TaxID=2913024 RepID=UPI003D0EF199
MAEAVSFLLEDASATERLGRLLGEVLCVGEVVALIGELGAGKTTLMRGLAEGLGVSAEAVSSPTFVMIQEYSPEADSLDALGQRIEAVVHIDAYRLKDETELAGLGWEGVGEELRMGSVVVMEWADRVMAGLPVDETVTVRLVHAEAGREAVLSGGGFWEERLALIAKGFAGG